MLRTKNLSFAYGNQIILRDLTMELSAGECLVLTGPNGSGKSTFLSLLAGITKPGSGTVTREGKLALVPQGTALFEDMSVEDNFRFFAELEGVSLPSALPFSLEECRKMPVGKLSGGQKKRVSIGCALLGAPANLLLDEPCAGLDLSYQAEFAALMRALKERGCSLVYAAHDPAEYIDFADYVLFLGEEKSEVHPMAHFFSRQLDREEAIRNISDHYMALCQNFKKHEGEES